MRADAIASAGWGASAFLTVAAITTGAFCFCTAVVAAFNRVIAASH